MRKLLFTIAAILQLFPLISCKTVHEVLANTKFDEKLAAPQLHKDIPHQIEADAIYPFTLNHKAQYGCPVINFKQNDKDFFAQVDTGSPINIITNHGLETLGYNVDDFIENDLLPVYVNYKIKDAELLEKYNLKEKNTVKKLRKILEKDFKYGLMISFTDENKNNWWYSEHSKSKLDCILGEEFLKNYKSVTFDFTENLMIFNGAKIEGNEVPFKYINYTPAINFEYNGLTELGIIDTGNYTFSPRSNFGKLAADIENFDTENLSLETTKNYKIKRKAPFVHTYNGIKICDIEFNNIKGVYSTIWFSTYAKNAQILLQFYNGIGCELFQNHIIQIDYENMLFRMK